MSNKNLILIIVAIILIIILSWVKLKNNKNNEEIVNSNQENVVEETTNLIATTKTNGTFEIFNTDITTDTGATVITATVKNVSGTRTEEQKIEIVLLDEENNEIGNMTVTVPSLGADALTEIKSQKLTVIKNIYDFKIK